MSYICNTIIDKTNKGMKKTVKLENMTAEERKAYLVKSSRELLNRMDGYLAAQKKKKNQNK